MYTFVAHNIECYGIDTDCVYFAGDPAGVQLVSSFVNTQAEKRYAGIMLPKKIEGVLGIYDPYDVARFVKNSDNSLVEFFIV